MRRAIQACASTEEDYLTGCLAHVRDQDRPTPFASLLVHLFDDPIQKSMSGRMLTDRKGPREGSTLSSVKYGRLENYVGGSLLWKP